MSERLNSTNDVGRALYAATDARVAELAERIARKKADRIRLYSFGLIKPTRAEIEEMREAAVADLYAKLFRAESARIHNLLELAAQDGGL